MRHTFKHTAGVSILSLGFALALPGFADVGPGLYVSEQGTDRGDCTNVEEPCATIKYALSVAAKNTRIHVATGTYEFADPQDIIYAMTGAVHVHGGYVEDDQGQWIKGGKAFLTSVPKGYRDFFRMHGFVVIVDSKGDEEETPETAQLMLQQYQRAQQSAAAADCVGGNAGGFDCNRVNLLSQTARANFTSTPTAVADIWGFVDLNTRREYVIVGVQNGTAVFDVTDPLAPREVGFVGGRDATWRDIKVLQTFNSAADRWQAYAYVTTDGAPDGLVIIDLGNLPHSIEQITYASDFQNAHNVYVTDTDYATGLPLDGMAPQLIIAGSGRDNGQFRTYSLANPQAPQFIQRINGAGYMHDATSLRIDDARAAQCSSGGSDCNVLIDFNEENVEVWDVTSAANPTLLAVVPEYPNTGYVHSGWWSEDRQFVFVHDELDEVDLGLPGTTVRVLSLADLTNPALIETWSGPIAAIDHNGFVRGNRYYMSTYSGGLTVLDITDPTALTQAGFFDTYPVNNAPRFAGAWGAYPFLPSGNIAVSDINSGLYMLEDDTRNVAQGALQFDAASNAVSEGQSAALTVSRNGGSSGSVSVGYEIVNVTTTGADTRITAGRLAWTDGDGGDQTLLISAEVDSLAEPLEELQVRLVDPRGGATLGTRSTTSLFIADTATSPTLVLDDDDLVVTELGVGLAVVTVQRRGNAAGTVSVDFSVADGNAISGSDYSGPASGTLTWPNGDALPKSVVFEIANDASAESSESFELQFSNAQGATLSGPMTATITILNGTGVNRAPSVSAGANQQRTAGTNVMLNGSATFDPDGDQLTYAWTQQGGPTVTLNSANTPTATFVAPSVTAATSLTFRLAATDTDNQTRSATTVVTVVPQQVNAPGGSAGGGSGGGAGGPLLLALLGVAALLQGAVGAYRSQFRRRSNWLSEKRQPPGY